MRFSTKLTNTTNTTILKYIIFISFIRKNENVFQKTHIKFFVINNREEIKYMIFTVDKSAFEKAVTPVSIIAQSKAAESSMGGIFLEAKGGLLTLYCYDIEKGIKTTVEADIEKEGKIIADTQIVPIIHSLPEGDVRIVVDDNYIMKITAGDADFQILGRSADTYPAMPEVKGYSAFKLSRRQFKQMITRTIFAVSNDDTKPILKGSLFNVNSENITISAIDGFRVAVRNEKSDSENPELDIRFIMPGRAQQNLIRLMDDSDEDIVCELSNKHIIFTLDNLFILIRLLEGDFPDYTKYVPQPDSTAVVDRVSLIASLERVALINDKLKASARLQFANDQLKISCETDKGKINDLIPVYMEGDPIEVNFNQNYLIDALKACDNDKVLMRIASKGRGLVIVPRDEDKKEESTYLQLVMPVRSR